MAKKTTDIKVQKSGNNFPVVGIGASAGGLDAHKNLIGSITAESGMAYVIVQHLSPDHDSNLVQILQPYSVIPVNEIINHIHLEPNNIYIIPENKVLTATDGILLLSPRSRNDRRNTAIDTFFKSLAEVHTSMAVGVILSGTAFDGIQGLKAIREHGGATIAQDPATAAFTSMPQGAIDAETVDYILTPKDIAPQLLKIAEIYKINHGYTEEAEMPAVEQTIMSKIIDLISNRSGNDFKHYKQPTVRRRIARRMVMTKKTQLEDYYNLLRNDVTEQDALFNDLLIPVTYFFRDSNLFENLFEKVFPQLLRNRAGNNLRIWVAGCSTGEEAYSLAICIREFLLENSSENIRVQIFASDISERVIAKARLATYSAQDVQNVSEHRLRHFFTKRDGDYLINKEVRDMCIFAVHNFLKDPPFAKIDLITCRNVLIYLDNYLQTKVFNAFHYSLREKGILFLGRSESASAVPNLFESFQKHEKTYVKIFAPGKYIPEAFRRSANEVKAIEQTAELVPETDFRKIASEMLFANYTPAGVIISAENEIVHFHGDTSPFLIAAPGKPNFNILKMAREGIEFELRNLIAKGTKAKYSVSKENIPVDGQDYMVNIEIVPLKSTEFYLLVLFKKSPAIVERKGKTSDSPQDVRILQLETELSALRTDIKRVTDEQQASFEELQTTNEELLSSSEELQALNEELETSSEELQSNNEELMCVNDELMDRQEQLISLRNYAESIVATIREPLIVLENHFRVKSANPAFLKAFHVGKEQIEGQYFFDIADGQWDIPELRTAIENLLKDGQNIENLSIDSTFRGDRKRTLSINGRVMKDTKPTEFLLLSIEDLSEIMEINSGLNEKNRELINTNDELRIFSNAAKNDIQEPLRKMTIYGKMLLDPETSPEDSKRYLERMVVSVENMYQLTDDLLQYTEVSINNTSPKKFSLDVALKKAIKVLEDRISESGAKIESEPLTYVLGVQSLVQELLVHLIENSIKFASPGTDPIITIGADFPTQNEIEELLGIYDHNFVRITISDNGVGFNDVNADKIFTPFFRLHGKDKFRGSGLGLTQVKKIMAKHNGYVTASSKMNEGTTVLLYFPIE